MKQNGVDSLVSHFVLLARQRGKGLGLIIHSPDSFTRLVSRVFFTPDELLVYDTTRSSRAAELWKLIASAIVRIMNETAIKFRSNEFSFPSNRSIATGSWCESCFVANRVGSNRRWEKTDTGRTQLPQTDGRDGARAWPAVRAKHARDDLGRRAGSQGAAVG